MKQLLGRVAVISILLGCGERNAIEESGVMSAKINGKDWNASSIPQIGIDFKTNSISISGMGISANDSSFHLGFYVRIPKNLPSKVSIPDEKASVGLFIKDKPKKFYHKRVRGNVHFEKCDLSGNDNKWTLYTKGTFDYISFTSSDSMSITEGYFEIYRTY